ncbi:MAG: hypothetical protein ACLP05_07995 [Candidatus Kryptoniota bacterium]
MSIDIATKPLQPGDMIECLTCEKINVFYSGYVDEATGVYSAEPIGNGFRCGNCQAEFPQLTPPKADSGSILGNS